MSLISLGNLIPCSAHVDLSPIPCGGCGLDLVPTPAGNFLIDLPTPAFLCDQCGRRARPTLWPYLEQLRACVRFVPTIGGSESRICPVCSGPVDDVIMGWHIVDTGHGLPLCDDCCLDVDPAIVTLCHVLRELARAEALARAELSR